MTLSVAYKMANMTALCMASIVAYILTSMIVIFDI
jgi:hypothetical protein